MSRSIVLLEFIFSAVLFSIILILVTNSSLLLYQKNDKTIHQTYTNLQLEATQVFINKHNFATIFYKENALYFENHLLMKDVSQYNFSQNGNVVSVNICVENGNFCQEWKFVR